MTKRGKVVLLILLSSGVLALFFGGLLIYSIFATKSPALDQDSVLELRLSGEMPEMAEPDPLLRAFAGKTSTFKEVLDNIQKAKADKRIKGLLLLLDNPAIGQGKSDDLRDAIADFKKSGKPVFAYMERGGDREYSLAIAADKIYVAPVGDLGIKGFAAHATFMRGFFNKLKIEPNFARYGKYKSAVERYTREDMSEPEREEINVILDGIYNHYVDQIAKARKKDAEEIKKLIDGGPYNNAVKAKEVGLIDDAIYFDEVKEKIREQLKMDKFESITSSKYSDRSGREFGIGTGEKIAVIYAAGGIVSGKSNNSPFGEASAGSDSIAAAIKKAREDSSIKAIILRVDSPGGSALASDIIWREVMLTRKANKPIIAAMSDVAASGGYYISMACDKIVAQPGTITGSIGVFGGKLNINGLYEQHLGLNVESITRGKNADLYSEHTNFTEEQMTMMDQHMSEFYQTFITKVAEGRKLKVEEVDKVAQGRVWTGEQAKGIGLVDELGGMNKAVELAKQLAKLPADSSPQLVEYPKSPGLAESLFGNTSDDASIKESILKQSIKEELPAELRDTVRMLSFLKRLENEHVLALTPYQLTIK